GTPSKYTLARQLAGCIGYISLCSYDRVGVKLFGTEVTAELPPIRGKGSAGRLFSFLEGAPIAASGDFTALRRPAALPRIPGMSWIFSDFLYESGIEETLSALLAARQEIV